MADENSGRGADVIQTQEGDIDRTGGGNPFVVQETYGGDEHGKTYYVAIWPETGIVFTGRASRGEAEADAKAGNATYRFLGGEDRESQSQRSAAWGSVVKVLDSVCPSWYEVQKTAEKAACDVIRRMAQAEAEAERLRDILDDWGIHPAGQKPVPPAADVGKGVVGPSLRPSVAWFAGLMETTFRRHDAKKGGQKNWRKETPFAMLRRIRVELNEAYWAWHSKARSHDGDGDERFVSELVDTANFCLMAADVVMKKVSDDEPIRHFAADAGKGREGHRLRAIEEWREHDGIVLCFPNDVADSHEVVMTNPLCSDWDDSLKWWIPVPDVGPAVEADEREQEAAEREEASSVNPPPPGVEGGA